MPRRASPVLDAQSRGWSLAGAAACLLPLLLQLPPTLGIGIGGVAIAIAALAWRGALPGWLRLLLAAALVGAVLVLSRFAFGRDTGCALLAAMLALKPIEMATIRDARSLLGFALFAPFATFLLDQGPLSLALGLIGAALALAALLRLSELESGDARARAPWRRIGTVVRLVAIGLPLALAAFWLFPRLGTPLWGVPERALARPGLSDSMSPGEWIEFITDDSPALRVTFAGAAPPTSQMYWRGPVLWNFDGRTWTQPQWFRALPPAQVEHGGRRYAYEMEVEPTDRRQLVALELPTAAPDGIAMSIDYGLFARHPLSSLTRWRMQSAPPLRFESELKVTLRRVALRLPDGFNPRTLALARQWRREAGANDAAIVDRALRWIGAEFAYTLETPLLGRDSVDEFLFEQKSGFCEHYSSAFVVLMRGAGIPARVVTGYVGGFRNPFGDYWVVRRSDAHAWAEVWLAGRGWVRVDPTAAVAPERIYDTLEDRASGTFAGIAGLSPLANAGDWLRRGWNDFVLGFDASRQQRLLQPFGVETVDGRRLLMLFLAVAGLAVGWMLWLTTRGERERDPVLRAWRRMEGRYRRLGLARIPHEPAQDWALRVAAQRSTAGRPGASNLNLLSARFADWRYARDHGGAASADALIRDLRAHRPE